MATVSSNELWKVIAPIFGLANIRAKSVELRLRMNEPAEITLTHLVQVEGTDITTEIATRFNLTPVEER